MLPVQRYWGSFTLKRPIDQDLKVEQKAEFAPENSAESSSDVANLGTSSSFVPKDFSTSIVEILAGSSDFASLEATSIMNTVNDFSGGF